MVKIGSVDTEIALLIIKKRNKKKLRKVKYIARSTSLPKRAKQVKNAHVVQYRVNVDHKKQTSGDKTALT